MHNCTTPPLHVPPALFVEVTSATLRAYPKKKSSFHMLAAEQGRGASYPCTQQPQRRPAETDQEISAAPAFLTGICHGEVRPLSQKQLLLRLGSQPTRNCWLQWPTNELTLS